MGRSPCCEDELVVKKGPWTPEEDKKLKDFVDKYGHGSWRRLPKLAGLNRCGKSCRLRWTNYLRPNIKRGKFTDGEERIIVDLHSRHGNKWSTIAASLPGRTDNEIKNYWNTHMKKKLLVAGIDPTTHRPRTDLGLLPDLPKLLAAASLSNLAGSLQLQADAARHLIKLHLAQKLVEALASCAAAPSTTPYLNLMALIASPPSPPLPAPPARTSSYQVNELPSSSQPGSPVNGSLLLLPNLLNPAGTSAKIEGTSITTDPRAFPAAAASASPPWAPPVSASQDNSNRSGTASIDRSTTDTPISTSPLDEAWDSLNNLADLDDDLGYWKDILSSELAS